MTTRPDPTDLPTLSSEERARVYCLWERLGDRAAHELEGSLRDLMQTLSQWFNAKDVIWVGAARVQTQAAARRDPQKGWRGLVVRHLNTSAEILERSQYATKAQEHSPDITTLALIQEMGQLRVHRLHDGFVDFEAFRQTIGYRVIYEEAGIEDRMYVGNPINRDTESFLLVDRDKAAGRFTLHDADLLHYTMRGLKWFHRELMLANGVLVAGTPLTATERKILCLALTEKSEKEIADTVGQSPKTTHKYITTIARRFGVPGRVGLMALWLRRPG